MLQDLPDHHDVTVRQRIARDVEHPEVDVARPRQLPVALDELRDEVTGDVVGAEGADPPAHGEIAAAEIDDVRLGGQAREEAADGRNVRLVDCGLEAAVT